MFAHLPDTKMLFDSNRTESYMLSCAEKVEWPELQNKTVILWDLNLEIFIKTVWAQEVNLTLDAYV